MKNINSIKWLCILIILLSWCPAHADFINVISQQYSIEGWVSFSGYPGLPEPEPYYISYKETSTSPALYHDLTYAKSLADGGITSASAWVYANIYVYTPGRYDAYAYASATITFSPLEEMMWVTAGRTQSAEITLSDVTSGLTLYSYEGNTNSSESFFMSFDPSHVYSISAESAYHGADMLDLGGSVSIVPVPEPVTVLLLGLGLIGLAEVGRKFRN